MKKIPKKYQFKYNEKYDTFFRKEQSPIIEELRNSKLEEIKCPVCGDNNLRIGNFGDSIFYDHHVTCDSCEFTCPAGCSDYGEAKCEFEFWTEAFILSGKPMDRVNDEFLCLIMYPEGIDREKAIKMYGG